MVWVSADLLPWRPTKSSWTVLTLDAILLRLLPVGVNAEPMIVQHRFGGEINLTRFTNGPALRDLLKVHPVAMPVKTKAEFEFSKQ